MKPIRLLLVVIALQLAAASIARGNSEAVTSATIADAPITATLRVPANLLLALSVEWPTGVVAAYNDNLDKTLGRECPGRTTDSGVANIGVCFFADRTHLGYFDADKCYTYSPANYFVASGVGRTCSGAWSGNFLNWATTQAIDTFRYALTGGDRVIDTATQTVIEKARHTGMGGHRQFPIKRIQTTPAVIGSGWIPAVDPSQVSPYSSPQLFIRLSRGGSEITNNAGLYDGPRFEVSTSATFEAGRTDSYLARVEVCNPAAAGGLESNCAAFGANAKPVGLIQRRADRLNVGVFGYLLDSSAARAGGVLRARMKSVGPNTITPFAAGGANPAAEWNARDGTFYSNPDPADAAATGVAASGVINYLNKFGKASGYKSYDPIGELYYESLRYFKRLGPTPEYSSALTPTMADGFPVITAWNDPVQYACQKNSIAMVADVNAWCDTRLPGTSLGDTATCGSAATSAPTNADTAINVSALTDRVAALEGASALGGLDTLSNVYALANNARRNSWYIAGLAHYANTTDLRPDLTAKTSMRSTVQTYMVDVAETGSWSVGGKNQMWLAAKYGGFHDVNRDAVPASKATWDADGDGTPDHYFFAGRPEQMIKALADIFQNAVPKTESASGASTAGPRVASGDAVFQVQFNTNGWTGELFGNTATFDANGVPTLTRAWSARSKLDTQAAINGWDDARNIATWNGKSGAAFRLPQISAEQRKTLGDTDVAQQRLLEYLRGSRAKEGAPYRTRTSLLGDIVASEALVVGPPTAPLRDAENPGYAGFKSNYSTRPRVVYVGANDGMLHAFDADVGGAPSGGTERWAYVPGALFAGPASPATPEIDGLAALARTDYNDNHRAYVDATPVVADVDFARAGVAPRAEVASDWRTILVGGLGKGGRAYYALDVTDPAAMTSESVVADKVLWEFTDPDLGFSFGRPLILKTRKYGWVVVLASGYDNTRGVADARGKGFVFILDPRNGTVLQKIATTAGSATTPSGLAHLTGFTIAYGDATTEQLYGGDLQGNIWRFDVSQAAESGADFPAPTKIAIATDARGATQPITTAPRVEIDGAGRGRWVFVGTGLLMDISHLASTQTQSMYALRDGTQDQPFDKERLPRGVEYPLGRANLVAVTDLKSGVPRPTGVQMGWFTDLTGTASGTGTAAERVVGQPIANEGIFAWVGIVPSVDPCAPGTSGRTYAVRYETGQSVLLTAAPGLGSRTESQSSDSGVVKVQFLRVDGRVRLITSNSATQVINAPGNFSGAGLPAARVNWREIVE